MDKEIKTNEYRPKWSNDEVLVFFYLNLSKKTARSLGEALGCEYMEEWGTSEIMGGLGKDKKSNVFRFKTPVGKSREACRRFEEFEELVEWADPVDLKMESRDRNLEKVVKMLRDVKTCAPDNSYKRQIDRIVGQLYEVK